MVTLPDLNSALDAQGSTDPVGVVTAQQEPAVLLSQRFVPGWPVHCYRAAEQ